MPTHPRTFLPLLLLSLLLLAAFLALRFLYAPLALWPTLAPHLFLGWIILLFLLTTAAAIFTAATSAPLPRRLLAAALLLISSIILLLCIALSTRLITLADTLTIALLLLTWTAFWTLLANFLRRFSAPLALTLSLTLAAISLAAPITLVPLAHASSQWTPAAHDNTLTAIAYATPILPALQALNPSLPDAAGWSEWPLIYRLSDSAQEIALRARWPAASLLYATLTLALAAFYFLRHRFRHPHQGNCIFHKFIQQRPLANSRRPNRNSDAWF